VVYGIGLSPREAVGEKNFEMKIGIETSLAGLPFFVGLG
jgi:hypothetical protein